MPPDNLQARRAEARLAMEGDERAKRRAAENEALAKRRNDARLAMEGEARRRARAEKEKLQSASQAAKDRLANEINQKREEERKKIEMAKLAESARAETEKKLYEERLKKIKESELKISSLKKTPSSTISPIHTLKSDMARTIRDQEMSMASMALAEQNRQRNRAGEEKKSGGRWLLIILIIILLLAAGGALGFIFYRPQILELKTKLWERFFPETAPAAVNTPPIALLPTDRLETVNLTNAAAGNLRSTLTQIIKNEKIPGVKGIIFQNNGQTASFRDWHDKLALGWNEELLTALKPTFLFGVYQNENEKTGFLIIEINQPARARSGLRRAENELIIRLLPIINGETRAAAPSEQTTDFSDRLFRNLEIRTWSGENGEQALAYGLIADREIIIAKNEKILGALVERLATGL